jgi:hypothetical protein
MQNIRFGIPAKSAILPMCVRAFAEHRVASVRSGANGLRNTRREGELGLPMAASGNDQAEHTSAAIDVDARSSLLL